MVLPSEPATYLHALRRRSHQAEVLPMDAFLYPVHLRWADMDPNYHLRHEVYYSLGAQARVEMLFASGITPEVMQQAHIGPILFREECLFKREVRLGDQVALHVRVSKARADGSRWSFQHELVRNDGQVCALLNVDGAWIDTQKRKIAVPPQELMSHFMDLPRTADFEMLPPSVPKP